MALPSVPPETTAETVNEHVCGLRKMGTRLFMPETVNEHVCGLRKMGTCLFMPETVNEHVCVV